MPPNCCPFRGELAWSGYVNADVNHKEEEQTMQKRGPVVGALSLREGEESKATVGESPREPGAVTAGK